MRHKEAHLKKEAPAKKHLGHLIKRGAKRVSPNSWTVPIIKRSPVSILPIKKVIPPKRKTKSALF